MSKNFSKKDLRYLYERHFEGLRNFLFYKSSDVVLAEDLVQEVFIKIWDIKKEIQMETAKSLLYTMAWNLLKNHFSRLKVIKAYADGASIQEHSEQHSPQFQLEESEFRDKLNVVLENMPEGSRTVFLMNRIEKLKYNEIASRLGISVKAVEKRMGKAIAVIKKHLDRKI